MEEATKVIEEKSSNPRKEEAQLELESHFTQEMAAPRRRSSKATRSQRKVVKLKPQGSGFPLKSPVIESKGEGWTPIIIEDLPICNDLE